MSWRQKLKTRLFFERVTQPTHRLERKEAGRPIDRGETAIACSFENESTVRLSIRGWTGCQPLDQRWKAVSRTFGVGSGRQPSLSRGMARDKHHSGGL